jgi:hypothetical protein
MDMNGKIYNLAVLCHFINLLYIHIFTCKILDLYNYTLLNYNTYTDSQTVKIIKYLST